jgi:hypothetical protein
VASPEVEEFDFIADLPYPAVKCTISRVTYSSSRPRFWACLVIGTFYDAEDNNLWQTEVFIGHHDPRGWSSETGEFDDGPPPPRFAIEGKVTLVG